MRTTAVVLLSMQN